MNLNNNRNINHNLQVDHITGIVWPTITATLAIVFTIKDTMTTIQDITDVIIKMIIIIIDQEIIMTMAMADPIITTCIENPETTNLISLITNKQAIITI